MDQFEGGTPVYSSLIGQVINHARSRTAENPIVLVIDEALSYSLVGPMLARAMAEQAKKNLSIWLITQTLTLEEHTLQLVMQNSEHVWFAQREEQLIKRAAYELWSRRSDKDRIHHTNTSKRFVSQGSDKEGSRSISDIFEYDEETHHYMSLQEQFLEEQSELTRLNVGEAYVIGKTAEKVTYPKPPEIKPWNRNSALRRRKEIIAEIQRRPEYSRITTSAGTETSVVSKPLESSTTSRSNNSSSSESSPATRLEQEGL